MEEHQPLLEPLKPISTLSSSSNIKAISSKLGIIFRLLLIIFTGLVSIWANHEDSKGFTITIRNDAGDHTFPGKRFSLFYVSNDEASRIILSSSKFVENFLYPDDNHPKKQVGHVILLLASRNMTHRVVVDAGKNHEFTICLSPSVLEEADFKHSMLLAVRRAMTHIWLEDGQQKAPTSLINGLVEYVSSLAGGLGQATHPGCVGSSESDDSCWKAEDPIVVAQFLSYCEGHTPGFIGRLNQSLKDGWHDRTVDDALGVPARYLCASYKSSKYFISSLSNLSS